MRPGSLRLLSALAAFLAAWLVVSAAQAGQASAPVLSFMTLMTSETSPANASFDGVPTAPSLRLPDHDAAPDADAELPSSRAPQCDPRGAITFAPPPQMQDVEVSVDTSVSAEECLDAMSSGRSLRGGVGRGRAPVPHDAFSASTDAAVLATAVALAASARELSPAPVASTSCLRPGIRSTVDRPPRA